MTWKNGYENGFKCIGTVTEGLKGLVLWLKFNEGSGNKAYDSSFYHNNGTISGATYTDGKYGKALNFDGVDDYVDCGNDSSLDITDAITLEVWIYPYTQEENPIYRAIITKGGLWDNFSSYQLYYGSDNYVEVCFRYGTGHHDHTCMAEYVPPYQWIHIAATLDGLDAKLYINGKVEVVKTLPQPLQSTTREVWIGESSTDGGRFFNGLIDEVRIYNRALSEDEIKMLYRNCLGAVASKKI